MEDGLWEELASDAGHVMSDFVCCPRVFLINFVGVGLTYSLVRQGVVCNWREFFVRVFLQEVALFILWSFVPGVVTTIVSLWVYLRLYENALGDRRLRVEASEVVLRSEFELSGCIEKLSQILQTNEEANKDGQFCLTTGLHLIQRVQKSAATSDSVLNVEDIVHVALVSSLQDKTLERSLHRLNIQADRCISVTFGTSQTSAILCADSKEACEQWYLVLSTLTGRQEIDTEKECVTVLLEPADERSSFGIEDCLKIVQKSGRKVDENYMCYVIQSFLPQEKLNPSDILGKLTSSKSISDKSKKRAFNASLSSDQMSEFFKQIVVTVEVQDLFTRLQKRYGLNGKSSMTPAHFQNFLKTDQKEDLTKKEILDWISENERCLMFYNLSCTGFSNYIFTEGNGLINASHNSVYQDMTQPLSHYFIATSHNTYLTGDQFKGKSSVDAYINAFKRGCKCVELDCWDGPKSEPIIYHGHTMTSKVLFREVIQAVKDYGFCVSQYPVILSFENHCSVEQQKVMAQHLMTILGDLLYTKPIPEDEATLPSPTDLRGYVIVKGKKLKPKPASGDQEAADDDESIYDDELSDDDDFTDEALDDLMKFRRFSSEETPADLISLGSMNINDDDNDDNNDAEDENGVSSSAAIPSKERKQSRFDSLRRGMENFRRQSKDQGKLKSEIPKIAQELSDLVLYCQAVGFKGFEHSKLHAKHYEMSSFAEKKSAKFCRDECTAFLNYNQRQLSRIYPAGARIDSSNYNPVPLWNVGCQLVALNYQTPCREMHLNQGLFQDNGNCGYVLKPEFMRQDSVTFDPRGPFSDYQTLAVRIISGHQLPYKQERLIQSERSYQVFVRIEGVEVDVQCQKTNPVKSNGFNPTWNEALVFKVHVPDLALVSFSVCTKSLIAQQVVRFHSLRQGFRRVPLTDKYSYPLPYSYLLVHLDVTS